MLLKYYVMLKWSHANYSLGKVLCLYSKLLLAKKINIDSSYLCHTDISSMGWFL